MKQSNPSILNKGLCIVTIKAISVLAILQRKIIVFSFSQCLPQLSRGYFVSFQALWQIEERREGPPAVQL